MAAPRHMRQALSTDRSSVRRTATYVITTVIAALSACTSTAPSDQSMESTTMAAVSSSITIAPPSTSPSTTTTTVAIVFDEWYRLAIAGPNCLYQRLAALEEQIAGADGVIDEREWTEFQIPLQRAWQDYADASNRTATDLASPEWPLAVAPAMLETIDHHRQEARFATELATGTSYAQYASAVAPAFDDAASRVRQALGLPSAANDPTDWCALAEL